MHALKCKDSSKWHYIESFKLFLRAEKIANPDRLIHQYIRDMRSNDPRVRLRSQDRLNRFYEDYRTGHGEYAAWICFISARSFYNTNGCPIQAKVSFPKQPLREQSEQTLAKVNQLTPSLAKAAHPVLRSLILTLAESGIRIGSAVQIRYADIKEDYESNTIPMAIRLRGRITKTGLPYWGFALDDARDAIRDQLEMRKRRGETISDETLIFPIPRESAMNQIRQLSELVGLNVKRSGLREFISKLWRKRVQSILERDEYHINPNHVCLILQAKPRGRDASYSMPSKQELAREYMKAANELRVSGPLFVKPTLDELLERIQQLAPQERLRLTSELEKQKSQLSQMTTVGEIVDLLSEFGLVKDVAKPIEIRFRDIRPDRK